MSRGRRYNNEPKLNIKKVVAVILAIVVLVMFVIVIKKLLETGANQEDTQVLSYYPVYTNEKWGVIDSKGNIVIEPEMAEMIIIPDNKTDIFICTYDVDYTLNTYKTKIIDSDKKEKFTKYNKVEAVINYDKTGNMYYEKVLKVEQDGKYGLIDLKGKEILKPEYTSIEALKGIENSIIIKKDDKLGLCDLNGTIVITTQYTKILGIGDNYKNGYIVQNNENKYGVIDFNSQTILEPKYDDISQTSENNMYVVKEGTNLKLINKQQETLIENKFDTVSQINGDNIVFTKGGKYGVITTNSEQKIAPEYDDLKYTFDSYYIAKKADKYGIINTSNETILPFEYTNITYRKNADFIEAQSANDENTQILDNKFNKKLTGIINEVNIEKGYLRIRIQDEYKYYNFKFEEKRAQDVLTNNTIFLSKKDGKYGYVDKDGKVVVDYIFDDATEQNKHGFAAVKKDGKWGAIDKDTKQVSENLYELNNNLIIDFIGKWHIGEDINAYYYTDK